MQDHLHAFDKAKGKHFEHLLCVMMMLQQCSAPAIEILKQWDLANEEWSGGTVRQNQSNYAYMDTFLNWKKGENNAEIKQLIT